MEKRYVVITGHRHGLGLATLNGADSAKQVGSWVEAQAMAIALSSPGYTVYLVCLDDCEFKKGESIG